MNNLNKNIQNEQFINNDHRDHSLKKYQLTYLNSQAVISLPQHATDFLEVAEQLLEVVINFKSDKYAVENMSVDSIKSNEMLIDLNGISVRCILVVEFNGIEVINYLTTVNNDKYVLSKSNNNRVPTFFDNILISA
jgi:hypothetical protein